MKQTTKKTMNHNDLNLDMSSMPFNDNQVSWKCDREFRFRARRYQFGAGEKRNGDDESVAVDEGDFS